MTSFLAFFLFASARVLTESDIQTAIRNLPSKPPTNVEVIAEENYTVKVARVKNRNGPVELHDAEDRLFYVLEGRAILRVGGEMIARQALAPGEWRSAESRGFTELKMEKGSVLSVPRGVPYRIVAEKSDVSYLVFRTFRP